nr:immunoglobulin heavy chain junction region [Macaca mulatta]
CARTGVIIRYFDYW